MSTTSKISMKSTLKIILLCLTPGHDFPCVKIVTLSVEARVVQNIIFRLTLTNP